MKPEQAAQWKSVRDKGKFHYILFNGVLSYGLVMFVVMTFVVNRAHVSAGYVAFSGVLWSIGGALFGLIMWYFNERQHKKLAESAD